MTRDIRVDYLWNGKTVNGRTFFLPEPREQNWLRAAMRRVETFVTAAASEVGPSEGDDLDSWWKPFLDAVSGLERNLHNPAQYEDNRPGLFSENGKPLLVDPVFTFFDLYQYGVTGEDGFSGFVRDCEIPAGTTEPVLLVAVAMLSLDSAVEAADGGRDAFAAYLMNEASDASQLASLVFLEASPASDVKRAIRDQLARAGRRSGEVRRQVAKASPESVQMLATRLLAEGRAERDISSIIAKRHGVTSDYIRRLRKKAI